MRYTPHPPPSRGHPFVVARVASGDKNFTRNYLSGTTSLSLKTVLVIGGSIALFMLVLVLMG